VSNLGAGSWYRSDCPPASSCRPRGDSIRCRRLRLDDCQAGVDHLTAEPPRGIQAIVTNPPFTLAVRFAQKALTEVPYLALLLRTNFLESQERPSFFRRHPRARIRISSRRLPMMHRHDWQGNKANSNRPRSGGWMIARRRRIGGNHHDGDRNDEFGGSSGGWAT
jgi:hypothetical protein